MLVIGVTGNFGTGKTTVCQMLADLGAAVVNADELGHQVLVSNKQIRNRLAEAFGPSILTKGNVIDRKKLADVAFKNSDSQAKLNRIMHPMIYELVEKEISQLMQSGYTIVTLEAALLIEANWNKLVDQIWVTTASQDTIVARLKSQRGFTESEINSRLSRQLPAQEYVKHADVVINTDCSRKELKQKITELWHNLDIQNQVTNSKQE